MPIRQPLTEASNALAPNWQNEAWVESMRSADSAYFEKLGQPQKPAFMYIGCSDARVPANEILGLGPGEVFVQRNVANLVVGTDLNVRAVPFAPSIVTPAWAAVPRSKADPSLFFNLCLVLILSEFLSWAVRTLICR